MMPVPLRFAVFSRVSTERQAERGFSLRTQRKQLEDAVAGLKGRIARTYGGTQEHGTARWERKEFDRLLNDSNHGLFNAVMVTDLSRWSRDNRRSKEGLEILRQRNIRFFVQRQEYDLADPEAQFILGISGEVNELYAKRFAQLTYKNRVEGAKRGMPTAGTLPWGRIQESGRDEQGNAKWRADAECKRNALRWFKQYMSGKTFAQISDLEGIDENTIRRRLLKAGPTWTQTFRYQGKTDSISYRIPGLLTDEQVSRVRERAQMNRLIKNTATSYPLAHLVRCANCGSVFSGHNITSGNHKIKHYRHHYKTKKKGCTSYIPSKLIEEEIFYALGKLLSNSKGLIESVKAAVAETRKKAPDLQAELQEIEGAITAVRREQTNLIAVAKRIGTGDTSEKMIAEISHLEDRLIALQAQKADLQNVLDLNEESGELNAAVEKALQSLTHFNGGVVMHWPDAAKRKLAHFFFGTKRRNSDGLGVYVKLHKDGTPDKYWSWEARGVFGIEKGSTTKIVALDDQYYESNSRDVRLGIQTLGELIKLTNSLKLPFIRAKW